VSPPIFVPLYHHRRRHHRFVQLSTCYRLPPVFRHRYTGQPCVAFARSDFPCDLRKAAAAAPAGCMHVIEVRGPAAVTCASAVEATAIVEAASFLRAFGWYLSRVIAAAERVDGIVFDQSASTQLPLVVCEVLYAMCVKGC
jgi:hypothetical protein